MVVSELAIRVREPPEWHRSHGIAPQSRWNGFGEDFYRIKGNWRLWGEYEAKGHWLRKKKCSAATGMIAPSGREVAGAESYTGGTGK